MLQHALVLKCFEACVKTAVLEAYAGLMCCEYEAMGPSRRLLCTQASSCVAMILEGSTHKHELAEPGCRTWPSVLHGGGTAARVGCEGLWR